MTRVLLALGSNLGERKATLDAAVIQVANLPDTRVLATSAWIESAHVGGPPQPNYLNGASLVETSLEPLALLDRLQQVEYSAGRVRSEHWGPRTLDLDLLLYDDAVVESERLRLPHPRLPFRRFVLEPAAEVAPDWVHPLFGATMAELLQHIATTKPYLALLGPPGSGKTRLASELTARTGARLVLDPASRSSASPEPAGEIEFLARRAEAMAAQSWPADDRWTVCDFWLPQSLAWWNAEHGEARQIENAYESCALHAVPARFVVALDIESTTPTGDDFGERLRSAMLGLTRSGCLPPVLWLASDNRQRVLEETAAILAG